VIRQLLAKADLRTAFGQDDALQEIGPVFAAVTSRNLRERLVEVISDAVDLKPDATREELHRHRNAAPPARRSRPGDPAPEEAPASRPVARPLSAVEEIERTFLAQCLALPAPGAEALARLDFDEHFTSPLHRRLAAHVRDHASDPLAAVGADDDELRIAVSELEARRSRDPSSPATLDAQRLQLELRRLTRRLNAARQAGEPGVTALAAEREQIQAKLNDAIERAMSTS
jgi:DNA primase